MNPNTFATILFRVLAIYLGAEGIMAIFQLSFTWLSLPLEAERIELIVMFGITLLTSVSLGVLVWFLAPYLAKKSVPQKNPNAEKTEFSLQKLQGPVISLVGLVLIVYATPSLVSLGVAIANSEDYMNPGLISRATGQLVKLILGLVLVIKTPIIVAWLTYLREFGLEEKVPNK